MRRGRPGRRERVCCQVVVVKGGCEGIGLAALAIVLRLDEEGSL